MKDKCCEWHDALPDVWEEMTVPEDSIALSEAPECGLAGMGTPSACCDKCPAIQHIKSRNIPIDYALEKAKGKQS